MDAVRDVAVFVGSLRKDSINRKVANALVEIAPPLLELTIIEIGQLPLYNQDADEKSAGGVDGVPGAGEGGRCRSVRHA